MILMRALSNQIDFLVGDHTGLSQFVKVQPLEIFPPVVLSFWAQVSARLLSGRQIKQYPDVATFAFFCRKAHLLSLQKSYLNTGLRLGRGVIFHIAPSNVPVNFAYSLLAGMLSGNANVVRVSSKDFVQVNLICQAIHDVLEQGEFGVIRERLSVVRYPRDLEINQYLSSLADVRVIWGGDATISEVRRAALSAKAYDICFADRYSFALFKAEAVMAHQDLQGLASNFYNDTYLFDQNACSAPRLVVWLGDAKTVETAQQMFWTAMHAQLLDYRIDAVAVIDKLTMLCMHADDQAGIHLKPRLDNKLWRVALDQLSSDLEEHRCAAGYFLEYVAQDLTELSVAVNRKYQTLAYFGFEKAELDGLMRKARFLGIDRVVPVGQTTDFNLTWDGHDLVSVLSRACTVL